MKPSDEIRKIWEEMKQLKRFREASMETDGSRKWRERLEEKFYDTEVDFGHESTLSKAIIYYLDQKNGNSK